MYSINVSRVQPDGMCCFRDDILEGEEVVGHLWWTRHLGGTIQTQHKQVKNQTVELHDEGSKLQATGDAVGVGVVHVL